MLRLARSPSKLLRPARRASSTSSSSSSPSSSPSSDSKVPTLRGSFRSPPSCFRNPHLLRPPAASTAAFGIRIFSTGDCPELLKQHASANSPSLPLQQGIGSHADPACPWHSAIPSWFSSITAFAILSIVAAALLSAKDESAYNDAVTMLSTTFSSLLDSAVDVGRSISARIKGLLNSLSSTFANAYNMAIAMGILVLCVNAVVFSKGEDYAKDLTLRWRLCVTSLLADLAGASHVRRRALVQAGNGAVVDWLLEAIGNHELESSLIQAEAARAVAHFLSDAQTCEHLLTRPNALTNLLLFTASVQPNHKVSSDDYDKAKGRSMLVAAIMEIVTSSCEFDDKQNTKPKLSGSADNEDIAAALRFLYEGGSLLEEIQDDSIGNDDDRGRLDDTGIRILGDTGGKLNLEERAGSHGLWDDLQGRYVAVPLAAWALATWAEASPANCSKIARLDEHGSAIMTAIMAPERTVKWHGAVAARHLVENGYYEPAVVWSTGLLTVAHDVSNVKDVQLAVVILNSFHSCISKSAKAREAVLESCLPMMRSLAKLTFKNINLQKIIAEALEILNSINDGLPVEEGKKWSSILLYWIFNSSLDFVTRSAASRMLVFVIDKLGQAGNVLLEAWLAMLVLDAVNGSKANAIKGDAKAKSKSTVQNQMHQSAVQAANNLAKTVWQSIGEVQDDQTIETSESPWKDFLLLDIFQNLSKQLRKDPKTKIATNDTVEPALKALKALTELSAEDRHRQINIVEAGGLQLLRKIMLTSNGELFSDSQKEETCEAVRPDGEKVSPSQEELTENSQASSAAHLRKHAARLLSILSLQPPACAFIERDRSWCTWLEDCADGLVPSCSDLKLFSYARATLLNMEGLKCSPLQLACDMQVASPWPRYEDKLFLFNTESCFWKDLSKRDDAPNESSSLSRSSNYEDHKAKDKKSVEVGEQDPDAVKDFQMDVVFVHGLCGGPFKTWRISDNKTSTTGKAGLVEKIDIDSGREGTCWPKQWLASDLPACRLLTVKYKTNLSQWSGATLPLQEVSAMLLDKLLAAGVGDRPVVFVTHSMGGLVVKQMLMQAWQDKLQSHIVKKTCGIVFYSCPHFGSKLADMPWRFGLVLRPAPSIGELRSGSTRLEELNQFIRNLHKGGLEVLSFSETKVTPLVEGYGGWALRMEVVPIESAYPGFGELVVLDGTDHVNSCKPLSRDDAAYAQTLLFLQKLSQSAKNSLTN